MSNERTDLLTVTLVKYSSANWGWHWLGKGRRAIDLGRLSVIIEVWF